LTRYDLAARFRILRNQLRAGEIDPQEYRLLRRAAALAYSEGQPARRAARRKVQTERDAGRMAKPAACERCGSPATTEAHHSDYALPLLVEWFCPGCHTVANAEQAGRVPAGIAG
jgi:hypothetical protein